MNAYFESLSRTNNVRKSQLFLVDDKAALPASELLQQLHHNSSSDVSSSDDQGPEGPVSCASIDIRTLANRYSFNFEDQGNDGVIEDLNSSAWCLEMSEISIGSPQGDQESMILSSSKANKKKSDQQ